MCEFIIKRGVVSTDFDEMFDKSTVAKSITRSDSNVLYNILIEHYGRYQEFDKLLNRGSFTEEHKLELIQRRAVYGSIAYVILNSINLKVSSPFYNSGQLDMGDFKVRLNQFGQVLSDLIKSKVDQLDFARKSVRRIKPSDSATLREAIGIYRKVCRKLERDIAVLSRYSLELRLAIDSYVESIGGIPIGKRN